MTHTERAVVVLEDGSVYSGSAYGARGRALGEIVFSTGMTGYQETFTDPSYHGQIIVMTAPHIGNTGVNAEDAESRRYWARGVVIRDPARRASNWRSNGELEDALAEQGVVGVRDVDTRALTRHLRQAGVMRAGVFSGSALPSGAAEGGAAHGYRNAQASVLAPTGTIGFMMDCDTTGVEPDFSLVKFKKLVGGSSMQIVNGTVSRALKNLGYDEEATGRIVDHIAANGNVVGAPGLAQEHYEVFDTAMGVRAIPPMGHVRMMAAVQPFISGAISKTVNMPESATVEDIADVYMEGWRLGLKALAVYRDNCKVGQPLSAGSKGKDDNRRPGSDEAPRPEVRVEYRPRRRRLPKSRAGRTTSFSVAGAEGYITTGAYESGKLGEIFLKLGKQGSTLAGVMDAFSIAVSIGLQYGVPLEGFVQKFTNLKFEPAGMTDDPDVRIAQSILDYVFRRLALDYLDFDERAELGIYTAAERAHYVETGSYLSEEEEAELPESEQLKNDAGDDVAVDADGARQPSLIEAPSVVPAGVGAADPHTTTEMMERITGTAFDAPLCMTCGTKMRPSGSCYVCEGCGSTSGCS